MALSHVGVAKVRDHRDKLAPCVDRRAQLWDNLRAGRGALCVWWWGESLSGWPDWSLLPYPSNRTRLFHAFGAMRSSLIMCKSRRDGVDGHAWLSDNLTARGGRCVCFGAKKRKSMRSSCKLDGYVDGWRGEN
eukprot:362039-Chlamydomonas_euryale.AAC.2